MRILKRNGSKCQNKQKPDSMVISISHQCNRLSTRGQSNATHTFYYTGEHRISPCLDWALGFETVWRLACSHAQSLSWPGNDLFRQHFLCGLLWQFISGLHCRPQRRVIIPMLHPSCTPSLALTQLERAATKDMSDFQLSPVWRSPFGYRASSNQNHVSGSEQQS